MPKRVIERSALSRGSKRFVAGGYVASAIYCVLIVIPLYYVLVSAFKDNGSIIGSPFALPATFTLDNFTQADRTVQLIASMKTSLIVSGGAMVATFLLAFPAAYAIARVRTRLSPIVEGIFSVGFLIPAFAMLVPVFLLIAKSGLLNNPLALVAFYPATQLPLSVLLLASYLRTIPRELEESAQIDGATHLQMMTRIFLPLARPAVVTVLALSFINIWNEFFFALVLTNNDSQTVQVALSNFTSAREVFYGLIAAGVVLVTVPVLVVFVAFQERVVSGLSAGAVKG